MRQYRSIHRERTADRTLRETVAHRTLDDAITFCQAEYGPGGDWWIAPFEERVSS